MSEPISKSVNQTVINLLTLLAQQGDPEAIAALERDNSSDGELEPADGAEAGAVKIMLDTADTDYLITEHGVTAAPKSDQRETDIL
ncbi:hypothetical protein H6F88_01620 [Oculatella sp. FACHB-28]|uniref:hypothetical protein n=1 Tax=Cyanophyceae TaxID=3028117 RepID=UPI001687B7E5|nr:MULTISPECIES: hypothetical protein [Cyanophyceae]MBD2054736.1 hypothetical protein [Oculatella sp. FACHB-28]MBD2069686.1 hypothetical protein [Leptolyngbya sp. FACHB-671]